MGWHHGSVRGALPVIMNPKKTQCLMRQTYTIISLKFD